MGAQPLPRTLRVWDGVCQKFEGEAKGSGVDDCLDGVYDEQSGIG